MSVEGIYLAGIGGQGIVTLAKLIAANLEQRGFKTSLLHATGMAQRGGRVTSEIRFSDDSKANFAPRISGNEADILISMENGEGISSLRFLKDNGLAILLDYSLVPAEIILKKGEYPGLTEAVGFFSGRTERIVRVEKAANPQNIFILGLFSEIKGYAQMDETMKRNLKKNLDENLNTFYLGCEYGKSCPPVA